METTKCITFDKEAQESLPQHIKDKMKSNMESVKNVSKKYNCPNCKKENTFKRRPYKAVSGDIAGYCKYCQHVIWG